MNACNYLKLSRIMLFKVEPFHCNLYRIDNTVQIFLEILFNYYSLTNFMMIEMYVYKQCNLDS